MPSQGGVIDMWIYVCGFTLRVGSKILRCGPSFWTQACGLVLKFGEDLFEFGPTKFGWLQTNVIFITRPPFFHTLDLDSMLTPWGGVSPNK